MTNDPPASARWLRADSLRAVGATGIMTTRYGGVSVQKRYGGDGVRGGGMNLGANTADEAAAVSQNRGRLEVRADRPVVWLRQVHGTHVVVLKAGEYIPGAESTADGAVTNDPGIALAVLSADCLPVLLAAPGIVGVAHAGWRGLAAGVIEQTVEAMHAMGGPSRIDPRLDRRRDQHPLL